MNHKIIYLLSVKSLSFINMIKKMYECNGNGEKEIYIKFYFIIFMATN